MVDRYNRMAEKARASALALASLKEARREMAMQVAHEIKNPLTPMKLGIQQLDRAGPQRKFGGARSDGVLSRTLRARMTAGAHCG